MTSIPLINQGSSYYAGTGLQDEINQLSEVAAIAPLTQNTNSLVRFQTDQVGPGTEHNLLRNTPGVILSDAGDVNAFNSILLNNNASIPVAGALWKKTSDGHLYFGAVDLQAGGSGDVTGNAPSTSINEIATYDSLTGKSIGGSNLNAKEDDFNVFITASTIPSISGGAQGNVYLTAGSIISPVTSLGCTFIGAVPGQANTSNFNTAIGAYALGSNVDLAGSNTAVGALTLAEATLVELSTAVGAEAGGKMGTCYNSALYGHRAGYSFADCDGGVMLGTFAGGFEFVTPLTGCLDNIFIGKNAGYSNLMLDGVSGCICIGSLAGTAMTDNTTCIYLDHAGVAGEDGVIRIGTNAIHTKNYQTGIRGVITGNIDAIPVVIDSDGQLGTVSSSLKYKENVKDLSGSNIIYQLRPVEFNLKKHPNTKSIGLIAEEVEKIYPEMCIYQDGELLTVDYSRLTVLLLAEVQNLKYEIFKLHNK